MASPKQPQSNFIKINPIKRENAKKTHNAINEMSVHFSFISIKALILKSVLMRLLKTAISNVKFCKKGQIKNIR